MEELALLGITGKKAEESTKNKNFVASIKYVVGEAIKQNNSSNTTYQPPISTLLHQLATRAKPQLMHHLPIIVKHILNGGIIKDTQLNAALDFVMHHANENALDESEFKDASGIGVIVTQDQIEKACDATIKKFEADILRERYSLNLSKLMLDVNAQLPWADKALVKKELELQQLLKIGPKTLDEFGSSNKKTKKAAAKIEVLSKEGKTTPAMKAVAIEASAPSEGADTIEELMLTKVIFHKPGENYKTDGYVTTPHTKQLLKEHLNKTGGKVITRFPPEPNGILHIGHAKAINIDFGYAKAMNGECNLRYDDTNPEREEEKFFLGIRDMVEWLGYKPARVTHASDRFDQLYVWALELIKSGNAYVCHQRQEDIKGFNPPPSPWRDRPIEESLHLFEDMKRGRFDEGEATLRMKVTLEDGKQDPVAYRIKYAPHHRTGDTWCIYPTYDYTHCLCDSIENITHSLCTKEFQARRSTYYWLCNQLNIYCPVQWEYGRLNVNYTVVSKRKIEKLVNMNIVREWDDPRLFTLTALRRRGVPAEAINKFVARLGVTMSQSSVDSLMLDAVVRDILNNTAKRCMAVLQPLLLHIINFDQCNLPSKIEQPDFPAEPARGSHFVPLTSDIYIDADDFREDDMKGFKRLTLNQSVGLVGASVTVTVTKVTKRDDNNKPVVLECTIQPVDNSNKPKGFIQWVCNGVPAEVRLYDRLFKHKNPEDSNEVPGGFLSDINENSEIVMKNALVDRSVENSRVYDKYQFQRIGYFSVDPDSVKFDKLVFNRTVSLKEDIGKSGAL